MGNIVIVLGGLAAMFLVGLMYYMVMPMFFNAKGHFDERVTDPAIVARSDAMYGILGIFPLIFTGIIFLNMYTKSTRDHSSSVYG